MGYFLKLDEVKSCNLYESRVRPISLNDSNKMDIEEIKPETKGFTDLERKILAHHNMVDCTSMLKFNESLNFSNSHGASQQIPKFNNLLNDFVYNNFLHVTVNQKVDAIVARYKFMEKELCGESLINCTKLGLFQRNSDEVSVFGRVTLDEDGDVNPHKVIIEF